MAKEQLVLIDANSLFNRAYYALPPLINKQGQPSGAVFGFASMVLKLLQDYRPTHVAAAFDLKGPTFRHELFEGYKASRKSMPEDLAAQIPLLKKMLKIMGIAIVEKQGYEADDIIGTIAKGCREFTYILTADRDSFQLIDDCTQVLVTKKGLSEISVLNENSLLEQYCLTPSQIVDYKAIAGDSSDCIPGVKGIGDKGALALLGKYQTLDGIYKNIDEISGSIKQKLIESKDMAYLSQKLARIDTNAPINYKLDDFKIKFPFDRSVFNFFVDNEFKTLLKRREIFDFEFDKSETKTTQKPVTEPKKLENPEQLDLLINSRNDKMALFIDNEFLHFAFDSQTEYIVPLQCSLLDLVNFECVMSAFAPVLTDDKCLKLIYNAKKHFHMLHPVMPVNFFDLQLAEYLLEIEHSPKSAALMFEQYENYQNLLHKYDMPDLFYKIEQPLEKVLYDMEVTGFKLDLKILADLKSKYESRMNETAQKIYQLCNQEFNLNSPKQLGTVLFENLKIPYPGKPPYSTKSEILEKLTDTHPVIKLITSYRFDAKILNTYLEGLHKLAYNDNTIHTQFNQMLTSTGRLSSVEPNLQNIPLRSDEGRELRAMFVPREGYSLVCADYSQIELKLLAHMSNDQKLITAFCNNEDIHTTTAAEIFGLSKTEVTKQMRGEAKAVNFGIIYGISNYGLAQNINIEPSKARAYIRRYFEKYQSVKQFLDCLVENAKQCGYAATLFNRRRTITELTSSNHNIRAFGERAAMNMPLQGTAADIIKIAMINVDNELKKHTGSRLILQIHDELIVEAKDDEIDKVKAILKDKMENAVKLKVPLNVEISSGKSWLECK